MQHTSIGNLDISRFGMGTKRLPRTDVTRVERLDTEISRDILDAALEHGVNFFDTGYSHHKGEAESFLGEELTEKTGRTIVQTSFFELVDPRYEYVFQKQLKKVERPCIDLYTVEGTCDLTRMRDVDSGAVDFLFKRKEAGEINMLGFSSELSAASLKEHLSLFPWDFVRLRVNFFDWFEKGVREQYETVCEAGLPVIAHASLSMGPKEHLKPAALDVLKEAAPQRSEIEWGLRFVKSLENVAAVSCNVRSKGQLIEDCAVFEDEEVLSSRDFELLEEAARAQKAVIRR